MHFNDFSNLLINSKNKKLVYSTNIEETTHYDTFNNMYFLFHWTLQTSVSLNFARLGSSRVVTLILTLGLSPSSTSNTSPWQP